VKEGLRALYQFIPAKQPLFSLLRHFPIPHSIYQHLHFRGDISVSVGHGRSFRIRHNGAQDENDLFWVGLDGWRERVSSRLWRELACDANVIFDLGANSGIFSLLAQSVNPNAEVYCFEPVKSIFDQLVANMTLSGFHLHAFPYAISDKDGETILYVPKSEHSYSATLDDGRMGMEEGEFEQQRTPTRTLASIIRAEGLTTIDLIKIDVELSEPQVLRGFGEYLATFRPNMIIEILSDDLGAEVERLVDGLGYLYFDINEVDEPKRVVRPIKSSRFNFLFCQPDAAVKLGLDSSIPK
jgi:FkbM family methyltransferase